MKKLFVSCLLLFSSACMHAECPDIDDIPKEASLAAIEKVALEDQCQPLLKAIRTTKSLCEKYKHPGIKQWRFLRTAYYIEKNLPAIQANAKRFLTKKETGLKHTLEYDPATGQTFIVLNSKKAYVGHGKKKTVHKAILYRDDPVVLARGEQIHPMTLELAAHKALQGAHGIMRTYAFTTHTKGKKQYTTIYSDLYQKSLIGLLENNKIGFRNKVRIMHDILKGLESIHSKNFVHRDLHARNYLLKVQKDSSGKKTVHAVIADLGRTIPIDKAKNLPAQGARRFCPPEGFAQKKLQGSDYFATDIYAVGCVFYHLFHNTLPTWQEDYLKSDRYSLSKKKKMLVSKLKKATEKRGALLAKKHKLGTLTIKEDAEYLILRMLQENPKKRGTATHLRQESTRILQRLHHPQ